MGILKILFTLLFFISSAYADKNMKIGLTLRLNTINIPEHARIFMKIKELHIYQILTDQNIFGVCYV